MKKVGVNKQNYYSYVKNALGKVFMIHGPISYLTHMLKNFKNVNNEFCCGYVTPLRHKAYC